MNDQISARELKRIESVFGEPFFELPWADPSEARAALDRADERAVRQFEARVEASWRDEAPWREVILALAELFPDQYVGSYGGRFADRQPIGFMCNGDDGVPILGAPSFLCTEAIRVGRYYGPDRPLAFADRPVSFAALAPRLGSADASLREFRTGWASPDVKNQLRTVFTRPGRPRPQIVCMVFVLGRQRRGFTGREHQRLFCAQDALRRWHVHAEALGRAPFAVRGLPVALLDAFEAPAVVLHRGRIVHANRAARALEDLPLDAQALRGLAVTQQPFVADKGRDYELLVLPRGPHPWRWMTLSPALREVAVHLARGLSDKEIAVVLDRPLSTVRTYTRRVFLRLGVRSRRELMQLQFEDPR